MFRRSKSRSESRHDVQTEARLRNHREQEEKRLEEAEAEKQLQQKAEKLAISEPKLSSGSRPHTQARSAFPFYPARAVVADEKVPWAVKWPDYSPTTFTAPHVLANDSTVKPGGWADPVDPTSVDWPCRASYEGPIAFDGHQQPLNPRGRTGMSQRGYLGKWGANHAADPIVTRFDPASGRLQVAAIVRSDNGVIALPGGMVDAGEIVSATVRREFAEEVLNLPSEAQRSEVTRLLDQLFAGGGGGKVVYRGYVDDPRNTDNAWMETTAFHFHATGAAARLQLTAGGDAARAFWLPVSPSSKEYASMLADHRAWVDQAAATLHKGGGASQSASLASRPPPATSSQPAAQGLDARLKSLGQARGRQ
mmetsp:Transcript_46464/g.149828  ORF Transcript_46464/g.149828 Transcript_46464/m.149828 type:complete len:365 (+) Transcript_46464:111-1205(+)